MQLPPALETKFNELVGRYPVKRSALIPMMLYAQDQFGFAGRRNPRRNREAPGPEHHSGHRNARLLLHAAPQARRALSHPGLHQYFLHAARRQRTYRARAEAAGHRQQGSFAERHVFARRSRMHGRLHRRSGHAGELRFLRKSRRRTKSTRFSNNFRTGKKPHAGSGDLRRAARTPARRSAGDQQALRHAQFAQDRRLSASTKAIRRSKKP